MTKYKKLSSYLIIFLAVIFAVCPAFLSPKPSANLHAVGEITDLTGTKWLINSTTCSAGYGQFDVEIEVRQDEEGEQCPDDRSSIGDRFWIGWGINFETGNYTRADKIIYDTMPSNIKVGDYVTFTGGDNVTDSSLISWLQSHATQIVTPEPTPSTGVIANIFVSTAMVSLFALFIVFAVVKNKKHAL